MAIFHFEICTLNYKRYPQHKTIDYKCVCYNNFMFDSTKDKVVKCRDKKCGLHFMYTEKDTKCPFCKTEYAEAKEGPKDLPAQIGKKLTVKTQTQKGSFKIWKDN